MLVNICITGMHYCNMPDWAQFECFHVINVLCAGMQVHANGICTFLSNRYENAVLSITITGYGGVAV